MLASLPEEVARGARPFMDEPLLPLDRLRALLADLEGAWVEPADVPRAADLETALALVDECRDLLRDLEADDAPGRRRVVQVALRYMAADADADDDLGSATGFDDDELVIAAARCYLERNPD